MSSRRSHGRGNAVLDRGDEDGGVDDVVGEGEPGDELGGGGEAGVAGEQAVEQGLPGSTAGRSQAEDPWLALRPHALVIGVQLGRERERQRGQRELRIYDCHCHSS